MFGVKSGKLRPLGGLFLLCGYGSYPTQPQHCSREGLQLWLLEEVTAPLQPLYFPCLGYLIFFLPWMPDFLWVQGFGYRGLEAERGECSILGMILLCPMPPKMVAEKEQKTSQRDGGS